MAAFTSWCIYVLAILYHDFYYCNSGIDICTEEVRAKENLLVKAESLKASQTSRRIFHNIKMYTTKLALLAAIAPMASAFVSGPVLSYNKAARKFHPSGENAVGGCKHLCHSLLRTMLLVIRFLSQMLF